MDTPGLYTNHAIIFREMFKDFVYSTTFLKYYYHYVNNGVDLEIASIMDYYSRHPLFFFFSLPSRDFSLEIGDFK